MTADLVIERTLPAPPELVFACLTDPHHLAAFWGPAGSVTPVQGITVEARPGGLFRTVMIGGDGSRYEMQAVFHLVESPHRLGWIDQDSGMRTEATLSALGQHQTSLRIEFFGAPAAMVTGPGRTGFLTSLDKFETYLKELDRG